MATDAKPVVRSAPASMLLICQLVVQIDGGPIRAAACQFNERTWVLISSPELGLVMVGKLWPFLANYRLLTNTASAACERKIGPIFFGWERGIDTQTHGQCHKHTHIPNLVSGLQFWGFSYMVDLMMLHVPALEIMHIIHEGVIKCHDWHMWSKIATFLLTVGNLPVRRLSITADGTFGGEGYFPRSAKM